MGSIARVAAASTAALIASLSAVAASAAPAETAHTVTIAAGPQTSFAIPEEATGVTITVAGQQGASELAQQDQYGGPGGLVTVDLGTSFNGRTLDILVTEVNGTDRAGAGAGFVAVDGEFLVVAGGGGSGGNAVVNSTPRQTFVLHGGAGGWADGTPDGGDAEQYLAYNSSGLGAVGSAPGASGYPATASGPGSVYVGTAARIVDGAIVPGRPGGAGLTVAAHGGQGYAGGGTAVREATRTPPIAVIDGAGGGGSGYVAPGLAVLSTGRNFSSESALPGFVTITWTMPAGTDGTDLDDGANPDDGDRDDESVRRDDAPRPDRADDRDPDVTTAERALPIVAG